MRAHVLGSGCPPVQSQTCGQFPRLLFATFQHAKAGRQLRGHSRFHREHGTALDASSSSGQHRREVSGTTAGTGWDCVYELECNAASSPTPWIPPALALNIQSAGVPLKAGITSPRVMNLASLGSPAADHHPVFGQW